MRYPSEDVARFDQQFAETEDERNDRLRRKRLARPECQCVGQTCEPEKNEGRCCWRSGQMIPKGYFPESEPDDSTN